MPPRASAGATWTPGSGTVDALPPGAAAQVAQGTLFGSVMRQSMVLSFEKLFLLAGICFLCVLPLVLLMRSSSKTSGPAADVHVEV